MEVHRTGKICFT